MVCWAFECVGEPLQILKTHYPDEKRPETAVRLSMAWAEGKIKMPEAKKAILQVHAAAKEIADPADIALCHAVGQACATVHVESHAIGLPVYELTAIVHQHGIENCGPAIADKIQYYMKCLALCAQTTDAAPSRWADFLLDDSRPNKELLVFQKKQSQKQG
ncbi:MAG TPA: hypothetical protein H9671_00555 [Firmicutes bacterium]|nr:hypothetical protein [Bacillota bacterium]